MTESQQILVTRNTQKAEGGKTQKSAEESFLLKYQCAEGAEEFNYSLNMYLRNSWRVIVLYCGWEGSTKTYS